MPIYEYRCAGCEAVFEVLQRASDPPPSTHSCGSTEVHRQLSHTSFVLKGTGWYKTDYPSAKEAASRSARAGEEKAAGAAAKGDAEPAAKGDAKAAAKGDAKGAGKPAAERAAPAPAPKPSGGSGAAS